MDNFADRDHCIQYMCATMLVFGRLEATDYTDGGEAATSPLVESLRQKIACVEDPQYTQDYHNPELRTISNALTVELNDGTILEGRCRGASGPPPASRRGQARHSGKVQASPQASLERVAR